MVVVPAYEVAVAVESFGGATFGRFTISNSWNFWSKGSEQYPLTSLGNHCYKLGAEAYRHGQNPDFKT